MNDLRKVQYIMKEILDYTVEICEKNNISYWLDSGTLLGAVRHKGFIPWDDDIDICMMKEDYNKFLKVFKNTEKYKLLEKNTDETYDYPYAKVVSELHFCENNGTKNNKGIWIDIFPMDFYDYTCLEKLNLFGKLKKIRKENKGKKLKSIKWLIGLLEKRIIKYKIYKLKKDILKYSNKGNKDIIVYDVNLIIDKIEVNYNNIFPLSKVLFEGKYYNCPNNYDSYLKVLYGDYMKLPEEKDRIGHLAGKYTFDIEDLNRILSKKD